jgi:hypothetical protein
LEHEAGDVAPSAVRESEATGSFGHRKKFLEPSPINFSLGSKPTTYKNTQLLKIIDRDQTSIFKTLLVLMLKIQYTN